MWWGDNERQWVGIRVVICLTITSRPTRKFCLCILTSLTIDWISEKKIRRFRTQEWRSDSESCDSDESSTVTWLGSSRFNLNLKVWQKSSRIIIRWLNHPSSRSNDPIYQRGPELSKINAYIVQLFLSHSPPLASFQTLSPLFSPQLGLRSRWLFPSVCSVLHLLPCLGLPPTEIDEVAKVLIADTNTWVVPDADVVAKVENGPEEKVTARWRKSGRLQEKEIKWGGQSWRSFCPEVFISLLIFIGWELML